MWRVYRKRIFPRWHVKRQNSSENKNENLTSSKILVLISSAENKGYSDSNNYGKKQYTNKQSEKFWSNSHFHLNFFSSSILETAGWLGAAAVICLNLHQKHIRTIYDHDRKISSCIFSRNVYTMPHNAEKKEISSVLNISDLKKSTDGKVYRNIDGFEDLRKLTTQYEAAVENATGFACIDSNDKKAFHCFQAAARLGSSQGFYNLGLCYELGKGTRINLNRAAFCYKKAAEKGHGLAAFNLAVYFLKGIGGLPVDNKTAMLLLSEAAAQNVPEAQTYIGLEYLENGKFSDAFTIFKSLAEKNIPDGKYYLGLCYENGWGVDKNEGIAAELFSQCACEGSHKATLQLGKYYEEGRGGCDHDCDFAAALYQTLAGQGHQEAQKALVELNLKQKISLKELYQKEIERSNMHQSTSVPELTTSKSTSGKTDSKFSILSYLDLMIPFFPFNKVSQNYEISKTHFYIGEKTVQKPNCFVPCYQRNFPQLMAAET